MGFRIFYLLQRNETELELRSKEHYQRVKYE
jgi:hypothetical protein